MSQELFTAAAEALWGPQYQSEAARQLDLGLRSVTRYAAGERAVPSTVFARLAKLLAQRQAQIAKLQPRVAAAGQEVV
jgi:hypothetical protein